MADFASRDLQLKSASIPSIPSPTMAESPAISSDSINVSVTHLQASRYPLLRRFDQQFTLETKFNDYESEISRVTNLNKVPLSSLGNQERRSKELQALHHSASHLANHQASLVRLHQYSLTRSHQKSHQVSLRCSNLVSPHRLL